MSSTRWSIGFCRRNASPSTTLSKSAVGCRGSNFDITTFGPSWTCTFWMGWSYYIWHIYGIYIYIYIWHIYIYMYIYIWQCGLFTTQFLGRGTHFRMCLCLRSFAASLTKIVAEKRPPTGLSLAPWYPIIPHTSSIRAWDVHGDVSKATLPSVGGWTSMNNSYFDARVPGFRPIQ